MCGIAGILGLNGTSAKLEEVQAMCDALTSRGPDDEGYYVRGRIGLGIRRLSIIDLQTGHQPIGNEDGSIQVVLNGEIYNFMELRQHLEARGHIFRTDSDTEVIVHLYEEYGQSCVHHLRGMFSFALWDGHSDSLFLARDRLGIKPLYYGEFHGHLVFASELKAILQLPWVDRQLNWAAAGHLFSFLSTPQDESIVSGVHKLKPGHTLFARPGTDPLVERYWDMSFEPEEDLGEEYCAWKLRELLDESVRLRMRSDVPVGAFLSGGIDSSAVVASMAQQSSRPVKTFSIGFPEKEYNETSHARKVSRAFGTEHHELMVDSDALESIEDLAWHLDEPFGDASSIPTFMVSKLASSEVKVVLSGDGGDELFAGYDKYLVEQRERLFQYIPSAVRGLLGSVGDHMPEGTKGRNFLRHLALDGAERYVHASSMFDREQMSSLLTREAAEQVLQHDPWQGYASGLNSAESHWLSALQSMDIKRYLPLDILTKVDRMSMANSLEARVPLLDHKLVEFAATIPPRYRLSGGCTKYILKRAMRGVLPDEVIDRKKQGFAVPLAKWFRGSLERYVRDLLLSDTCHTRGFFNRAYIERLLELHRQGRPLDLQLWTLISFELWCRAFMDAPAPRIETNLASHVRPEYSHPGSRERHVASAG